jgi:WD40 repeat protein
VSTPVQYPLAPELGYCTVVPGFLTPPECGELIALAEAKGFHSPSTDYPPTYRSNDRLVHDDESLSRYLFQRLRGFAPPVIQIEGELGPESWRLEGVNERLRFCRYTAQQQFNIHQDGVHHRAFDRRSMLTFMIYLTDGEAFSGGDTEFFADGPRATPDGADQPEVVARVRPKIGTLILFDHRIWHAGAKVVCGTKYILRSDVLYRNDHASSSERTKHQGYIWALARQGIDSFASGGRDCSIRIWDSAFLQPTAVLTGHTHSVLGLAPLDATRLASVSRDRTLRIWNVPAARCTNTVVAHDAAALTVVRLDGDRIATGAADRTIKIWSHAGGEIAVIRGHAGWVWKLVRVNEDMFASASEDGTVKLWHAETYAQIGCLPGTVPLRSVAASPDGRRLVTGDVTGRLRVWIDLQSDLRVESEYTAHRGAIRSVVFLGADTIGSGGEDYRMHIWRGSPWRSVYQAEHENFVTDIVALDAQHCASASYGGEIRVHQ